MKRGHVYGTKKEKPMTAKEKAQLESLSNAVWTIINAQADLEPLVEQTADAIIAKLTKE